MRRFPLHRILFASLLAAAGCGAFTAGAESPHGARGPAWSFDADARARARPLLRRADLRTRPAATADAGIGLTPRADAPILIPAEGVDTADIAPGAVLDVWLNDPDIDVITLSSGPSLGNAVVRGDYFRYTSVNADPNLRTFWGEPLLLKWSALLEVKNGGPHVFAADLSKERGSGAIFVRTVVKVAGQTVFEEDLRVFGGRPFLETGSRALPLGPGFHHLEVWLAVRNLMPLSPTTRLGTYLKIRGPNDATALPVQSSRIWHFKAPGEGS